MPERIGLEAGLDMAAFHRGLRQYLAGIDKMETTTVKKGSTMSKVLGGIGKIAAGVMAAGVAAGAAAIAGVGAIIKSTLPLAADFQAQLIGLQLAAGQSGLSFDELHDAALQIGGDARLLGVSATGAADAMTGLYKAGLTTTEIFGDVNAYMKEGAELGGALRAAIDLAAATELDMVQASDLAAIALATFGGELESEEERANFVAMAMDNLVRAANASVAEVGDLAAALSLVGPGAVAVGLSIEDVNNALAILSTAGISGTRAGTALDGMLRSLQAPGEQAAETIAALGIELYNVDGTFRELPDIIGQFSKALTVGGKTTKKMSLLTAAERKELTKLQKQRAKAIKTLDEYHKGLRGATQTEKTRLKAMAKLEEQINILNIDMTPLIDKSEQYTTVTREMTEAQRNQALGAIFTAQGQRAMNTLLDKGVEGWDAMAEATANAASIQEQAAARAEGFTERIAALQGQIETLRIRIGEAFLPIGESIADAFSGLIEDYGPAITEIFEEIGKWLAEKLPEGIDWLRENIPLAIADMDTFLEGIGLDLVDVTTSWDEETEKWITSLGLVEEPLKVLKEFIDPKLKEAMAGLAIAGTIAFTILAGQAATAAIAMIGAYWPLLLIGAAIAGLVIAWNQLEDAQWASAEAQAEWEKGTKSALAIILGEAWGKAKVALKEFWDALQEGSVEATEATETNTAAFTQEIRRLLEEFGIGFTEFWGETWDTISAKATEIWEAVKTTVSDAAQAVYDYVKEKIDEVRDTWGIVWDTISTKVSTIWETIKTVVSTAIQAVWQSLTDMYEDIKTAITGPLSDAWDAITDTLDDWKTLGEDLIKGIISGIAAKAQGVINSIVAAIRAAIAAARRALAAFSPSSVFIEIGAGMMEGLALGVAKTAAIPIAVTSEVMHRVSAPALFQRPAMTMPVSSSRTVNVNMGGVNIYDRMSEAVFEARVRQIVTSEVGG